MTAHFSPSPWRVVKSRRKGWSHELRDARGEVLAVLYDGDVDNRLIQHAPEMFGALKRLVAIVRTFDRQLRAPEHAGYEAARALVREIEGETK